MNEETQKILKMLEEGKINAAEAGRLLDALGSPPSAAAPGQAASFPAKTLHVRVYKRGSDRPKVNVNIPLSLAHWALRFIPTEAKAEMNEKGVDAGEILNELRANPGEIAVIEDEEEDQRVEVYIK